jgi:hypothetical protein
MSQTLLRHSCPTSSSHSKRLMDLSEIVACSNWSELVARLETKLIQTIADNQSKLRGIHQAAKMGHRTIRTKWVSFSEPTCDNTYWRHELGPKAPIGFYSTQGTLDLPLFHVVWNGTVTRKRQHVGKLGENMSPNRIHCVFTTVINRRKKFLDTL